MVGQNHSAANLTALHTEAMSRLSDATTTGTPTVLSTTAMATLHRLALEPLRAADALCLLQELQVHQIEIQAQREEMARLRSEAAAAAGRTDPGG